MYCDTIHVTKVMDTYKCDTHVDIGRYPLNFERRSERLVMGDNIFQHVILNVGNDPATY